MNRCKERGEAVLLALMGIMMIGGLIVMWTAHGGHHGMPMHGSMNAPPVDETSTHTGMKDVLPPSGGPLDRPDTKGTEREPGYK